MFDYLATGIALWAFGSTAPIHHDIMLQELLPPPYTYSEKLGAGAWVAIMSFLMYFHPVAIPSTFTTIPGKPSTHVYEGAVLLSTDNDTEDYPVMVYIFVSSGQASPLEGLYFISAHVVPPVKTEHVEQQSTAHTIDGDDNEVKVKEEESEVSLRDLNPPLLLSATQFIG